MKHLLQERLRLLRQVALGLVLGASLAGVAHAQSNASGAIFGTVGEGGGTIIIENVDTGLVREIVVDESGRYNATSLPIGNYKVTLERDGQNVATREGVSVRLSSGVDVSFTGDATELAAVVVTGAGISPIDVSSTDTRVVFTSEQLEKITVGRDIESIALLTPGVVEGDSRYLGPGGTNTASFGGSAASENAFYINGYAVTNPLTNLGSTSLPFDAISQFQAITGGYGAEFGRATGGVVNIITKSGTNDFRSGALLVVEPKSLRGEQRNIYYPDNGTANDGLLYYKLDGREVDSMTLGAYASGPIVKDRAFFYFSGELENREVSGVYSRPVGEAYDLDISVPRWIARLDWNISNNHLLDFTAVSDVYNREDSYYAYSYTDHVRDDVKTGGYDGKDGGELYIAKYTGYLTNDITVTALYGQQEQVHESVPYQYDPSVVHVSDSRNVPDPVSFGIYDQLDFPDAYDETNGYRFDIEWRVDDHNLRFGYDRQDSESRAGEVTAGPGYRWIYYNTGPGAENEEIFGSGGAEGPGGNGDYAVRYIYANGGTFSVEQEALYIEDRWQVSNNWLLSLGLRNEGFRNYNADSIAYVEQEEQWAPRLGASWDVFGDSTFKVFGQLGRYHLALPNNVALRGAAGSLYTEEYFAFTGIDPATGIPQGLRALGDGPYSSNNEYGQAPDPASVAAKGLKSHYQDELVLGFEKLLAGTWNAGARWVYRDLKSAIDDTCDGRPAEAWALANNYSAVVASNLREELDSCRLFNPGEDNTFQLDDGTGNLVTVALTAEQMGYPKLKRTYSAIDMFIEYPFDGSWYYKIDYTWSKNYGNAEGQLNSDIGQLNVSQTVDWDHPELMENKNGYLPNDRRHYLKAFGYYQMNEEWRFSGTVIAHSGRPKNCFGIYAGPNQDDPDFDPYGDPVYGYCDKDGDNVGDPSIRGTAGRLPWTTRLDLGVNYSPAFADHKLQLSMDVFNVLDTQVVQNVVEYGELGSSGAPYHSTHRAISYSPPRYVRFGARYDF